MDPIDPNAANPEVLAAMKQMTDQQTQLSAAMKQMADAIKSMVPGMKEMSDLSKAIKEQTKESAKAAKELGDATKENDGIVGELNKKHASMTSSLAATLLTSKDLNQAGQEQLNLLNEMVAKESEVAAKWAVVNEKNAESAQLAIKRNEAMEKELGLFSKLKEKAEQYAQAAAQASPTAGRVTGTMANVMTGSSRASEAIGQIGTSLASLIPTAGGIGGLLGLMISGKVEDAKFDAVGAVAQQAFDRVGGASDAFKQRITNTSRSLSAASMANIEDLSNVAAAFASTGVSAEEAQQRIQGFSSVAGRDVIAASLAMDKSLELPAGTMAKLSGTMAGFGNTDAATAIVALNKVGQAARESKMDMVAFTQSTMETSSALRFLNANLEGIGAAQLGMSKNMMTGGADKKFAQQYAAAGTGAAMQAIPGMSIGMSSVIGQRMGMGDNPLDAWYQLQGGDPNKMGKNNQRKPEEIAMELGRLAEEKAPGNRAAQVHMLMQLTGTSKQGADAMLDMEEAMKKGAEPTKNQMAKLNDAFRSETEKISAIETLLKEIKNHMNNIGSGMLTLIVSSLKVLIQAAMGTWHTLASSRLFTSNEGDRKRHETAADMYGELMKGSMSQLDGATTKVVGNIVGMAEKVGKVAGDTLPKGPLMIDDKELDRRSREAGGSASELPWDDTLPEQKPTTYTKKLYTTAPNATGKSTKITIEDVDNTNKLNGTRQ